MSKKTVVLCILDGLGLNKRSENNAVYAADTKNLDYIFSKYPFKEGRASGLFVGLPDGQMGNSEVGHLNLGAGRIIYQELTKITKTIQDGDFFDVEVFNNAIENCKKNNSSLHLTGLLSDGGVHSHNTHLYALLELAKRRDFDRVYVDVFLDGRDTPPTSGKNFVKELEEKMKEIGVGKISSVSGRYYSMDRDNRWERVELAYKAMLGLSDRKYKSAIEGIEEFYSTGKGDEFVLPFVIEGLDAGIRDKDSLIFFNFRPDRAREISRAFCDDAFKGFEREKRLDLDFVCFTEYDETISNKKVAFYKDEIKNTLGEYVSKLGLKQLRMAETEKYAHVTFFFNGGVEEPYEGEDRILVPSPKDVATYDLKPEMSAYEVCDNLVKAINSKEYDLIIVNFANPDMVGHTGIEEAAKKAVETVDKCVGKAYEAIKENGGSMLICADHGNAEQMIDYETKEVHTAHTTNPVPLALVDVRDRFTLKEDGRLCDLAPTLLELMGLEKPIEMSGESLLIKK